MLKHWITSLAIIGSLMASVETSSAAVYELRTYTTNDGKLENLKARFRNHTVKLFAKHGMKSVGYWVPTDGELSKNTLIYVIEHKSPQAADASWKAFRDDPEWQAAYKKSIAGGRLVSGIEKVYMQETDYSPTFTSDDPSEKAVFELRVYKTNEGKLDNLNARFRDHTVRLFNKHGIQSVAYWVPTHEKDGANDTLIYIVRHESREAAKNSWKAFGTDPAWRKVAEESQRDGQFLREKPAATYMRATDFSAIQ